MKDTRKRRLVLLAVVAAALAVPAAGTTSASTTGKGEGSLNMIAWEGYLDKSWVKPFQAQTGCTVHPKYAGSSDEMVTLMRQGGGGQYDTVSASGDASLRLIYGGDVAKIDVSKVPAWKQFHTTFQSPPNNTVKGTHYGISLQWGPNVLMYNTKKVAKPSSWSALYDAKNKGKITVPDNPIQIADAALYLSKIRPGLRISDPYELTKTQFDAAVTLLKQQKPLVKKYWALGSDEIDLFKNGDVVIGAGWPYQVSTLRAAKFPIGDTIPKEGATGWLDTWMVSAKAKHPNCAYLWLQYISTPKVQAMQAVSYGETPVNKLACPFMNKISAGACHQYHADAPISYYGGIKFWKTPVADCGNGKKECMDYGKWQQAWTDIRG